MTKTTLDTWEGGSRNRGEKVAWEVEFDQVSQTYDIFHKFNDDIYDKFNDDIYDKFNDDIFINLMMIFMMVIYDERLVRPRNAVGSIWPMLQSESWKFIKLILLSTINSNAIRHWAEVE